jgi:asparagine synthase (glutamine-hydrolysing)
MCGIVGIVDFKTNNINKNNLTKMNNILYHRGPDFGDIYINKNVGLGHRRLSIIDLTNKANQPMQYLNSKYYIVYNGEVYNYLEIKEELEKLGYEFLTSSDTEIVLASYIEWGEKCFHKFNGMWAFAIYDKNKEELVLCRDRFGVKPLYYYKDDDKFIFASEKKAIVLSEFVDLNFDKKGINTALQSPFILEASGFTEFENVRNLLPGSLIKINVKTKNVKEKKWYKLLENIVKDIPKSFKDRVETFADIFEDACKLRLRSDVPIATSLSGGLDSSSVVAMISKIDKNTKHKTFAHRFKNNTLDEIYYAKIVADTTNTPIEIIDIDKKEIVKSIDDILYYFESVYGGMPDSAYRIYKSQNNQGYKISIDGHGADEMLGGYGWYLDEIQKDTPLYNIFKHLKIMQHKNEITLNKKSKDKYSIVRFVYNKIPEQFQKKIKKVLKKDKETQSFYSFTHEELPNSWSHLKKRLYIDFNYTILPRILKNFDSMSMANSIEVRMPFLDYRLVEYVFSLCDDDLINNKWTKYILRYSIDNILDKRVTWRKDKKGFNSPVAEMLSNELKGWVEEIIEKHDETLFSKKELWQEYEITILNNKSWGESLNFWTKINALRLLNIYKEKKNA